MHTQTMAITTVLFVFATLQVTRTPMLLGEILLAIAASTLRVWCVQRVTTSQTTRNFLH